MAIGRIPEPGTGIPESIVDAKGDLVTATAADTPARLAVGTNEHRLVAASGETTGLKYVADTTNYAIAAKGDLLVGTAADTLSALSVGTNGYTLVADSAVSPTGLKWVGFSGASVYLTSNFSASSGSTNLMDFTSEFYDTDSYHDNVTNPSRLTVPKAGKYLVTMSCYWSTNNSIGYRAMDYYVNNSYKGTTTDGPGGNNGATTQTLSVILDLAANDYVTMKTYQNSGSTLTIQSDGTSTGMAIAYLGA